MRCPENKIKAAILHAEREVRDYALRYFSDAYSRDPSIMPLVIESVARHGRTDSFAILRSAEDLTQTPATMDWLLHELDQDYDHGDVQLENYYCALALILCHADPHLLAPFRDRLLAMPSFPAELHEDLLLQIRRADWDWPTGWKAFQECGLRVLGGWWGDWDLQQADAIVRALGQFRADGESTVLQLLNGDFRGHDQRLMQWLEPHLVALAGAMKLEAAIPLLVQRLASDKLDVMDAVGGALANIGTEEAVRAVTKYWTGIDENDRCGGEEVFEHIRCDLSLRTALDFLAREKNLEVACSLAHAALAQFDDDAIEAVRRFLLEHADDEAFAPDFAYLRWRFLVVAIVTGSSFPEYAAWCAEASDNNWGRGDPLDFRLVDHCGPDRDPDDFLDDQEELPDAEMLFEEYPPHEEYSSEKLEQRLAPIVNTEAKIGRNDPCPCGSGKKYKKCCVNKGNA